MGCKWVHVAVMPPRLEFPLHLPSRQPHQDSFRVSFLPCTSHGPCCLSTNHQCGKSGCTGSCPLCVVEFGYTAGKKPATCRICGKTFPSPNVTLSDSPPARRENKWRNSSQNASPAISWSVNSRHQVVKIQSWRIARSLTNARSVGRSKRTTNCEKISRACRRNTGTQSAHLQ